MTSKQKYAKSKIGVITSIWHKQLISSKKRGHNPPLYSKNELIDNLLNSDIFNTLFEFWVNSGYNKWKKPSIDRIDDYNGYSFENIRIVTWFENLSKSHSDVYNGINNKKCKEVLRISKDGTVKKYKSASIAGRENSIDVSSILKVCRGKRKTAGNYTWEYNYSK